QRPQWQRWRQRGEIRRGGHALLDGAGAAEGRRAVAGDRRLLLCDRHLQMPHAAGAVR
ncbi:unnamed protein product, partial [Phaeothamnion confervicola]